MNDKFTMIIFLPITLFLFTLSGCTTLTPGSKAYSPPEYAKENFKNSIKDKMPNDILKSPSKFIGKEIHWIGILKDVQFVTHNDEQVAKLRLSQKYWDYVEDYSIQTERMFLSNKGGGDFFLYFKYKDRKQFEPFINASIRREDLMFVYGILLNVEPQAPVLLYTKGSFVHERFYSTKIWEYDIKRDKNGHVLVNNLGVPVISNLKVLKTPVSGEND